MKRRVWEDEAVEGHVPAAEERQRLFGITDQIIAAAMQVHSALGPGCLEAAYEACLAYELRERGLEVEQQKTLPVVYKGVRLETGYRLDLLVNNAVVVEIKSVEALLPVHAAQLQSYLRLTECKVGLLINFHVPRLKYGIRRVLHGLPA